MARVAIVFAGGDPVGPAVRALLPDDAYAIAADSGLHHATALGVRVDLVVGDLDSVDRDALDAAVAGGTLVEEHPAEKDATDLELALDAATRQGAGHVVVVGGAGGRVDHFLANVALLTSPRFAGVQIEMLLGTARVAVARGAEGPVEIGGESGDLVTLLPFGGDARGITTKGLQYPLHGESLTVGTTRGVSNVVGEVPASVELDEGVLLVVQP
jgi:thiamine pyrophosphokinase